MNSNLKEALKKLQLKGQFQLRTPQSISLELGDDNKELLLKFTNNQAVLKNMQENASAFEGWSICLRALLSLKRVKIKWESPEIENDSQRLHYNRFIYRAKKFSENYDWVSLEMPQTSIECNFSNMIIGLPSKEAKEYPEQEEAQLEKEKCEYLQEIYGKEMAGRQLPTGLYTASISNKTALMPHQKSQIDLWAIENNTFRIYELKTGNANNKIGIISELMFYVNIMNDLKNGYIKYPDDKTIGNKVAYRNLATVISAFRKNEIHKIRGIFYVKEFHPWIACCEDRVIDMLNDNKSGITFEHLKS